jgi:hypothetical protein
MLSLFAALIVQLRNAVADRGDLLLENAALRQRLTVDATLQPAVQRAFRLNAPS